MASVNISFDTKTKDFSVTLDGAVLDDVSYVCLYKNEYGPNSLSVELRADTEDGLSKRTSLYASEDSTLGQANLKNPTAEKVNGLVKITENPALQSSIASLLGR